MKCSRHMSVSMRALSAWALEIGGAWDDVRSAANRLAVALGSPRFPLCFSRLGLCPLPVHGAYGRLQVRNGEGGVSDGAFRLQTQQECRLDVTLVWHHVGRS